MSARSVRPARLAIGRVRRAVGRDEAGGRPNSGRPISAASWRSCPRGRRRPDGFSTSARAGDRSPTRCCSSCPRRRSWATTSRSRCSRRRQPRWRAFGERASFWRGDLTDPNWAEGIGGPFDAVVSAHAIHNVRSHSTIAARVLDGVPAAVARRMVREPRDRRSRRPGDGRRVRSTAAPARSVSERRTSPATTWPPRRSSITSRWLTDAGFAEVDCLWKDARQALLVGVSRSLKTTFCP